MSTNYYAVSATHVGQVNFDLEKHGVHIGKTYFGRDGKQHFTVRGYEEAEWFLAEVPMPASVLERLSEDSDAREREVALSRLTP